MIFNSIEYLIFLPCVLVVYWLLFKHYKKQNILLLISSYIFYGFWDWRFLSLILYSSIIDYYVGLKINESNQNEIRRNWLLLSLVSNLGLLAIFKYYNFFVNSFANTMQLLGWNVDDLTLNIILPVGISFYTFQTLSYTIDIYRGDFKPTKDIISFFTYVSFFPQLVAGPIERASNLLPQIRSRRVFDSNWFNDGLLQIFIGLFRKIVIADNLGIYVDFVYRNPDIHNSSTLILATTFYAFQIYYDFAGYSDIAIGSAKLLGFKFEQNFNFPYFSKTLTEFWRRWHMSLSYWLRDYLYISLGGNRKGIKITYRNLMLTMLLGGLWHGSSWNFIIWGGIHGLVLSAEKYFFSLKSKLPIKITGYLYTFLIVLFSWVFFRTQDISSAFTTIKGMINFKFEIPHIGDSNTFIMAIFAMTSGIMFDFFIYASHISIETLGSRFKPFQLSAIVSIIIVLLSLFYSTSNNFIYFQF